MGHYGSNTAMPKFAVALVVLLLFLEAPVFSYAGLLEENFSSVTSRRGLMDSKRRGLATQLMHSQHVDSPYRQPNMTSLERAEDAVKSSKQRLSYFTSKISGSRKAAAAQDDVYTSPVYSSKSFYITSLDVGTPSRSFYFFVDTGSDLIWLQCTPCDSCIKQPDALFDPSASSTYTEMSCSADLCTALTTSSCATNMACLYDYSYGDQSYTDGTMGYETFTLQDTTGGATAFSSVGFGCGTQQQSADFGTYDGLLGLGGGPLSLVNQLDSYINGLFAYCLVGYNAATDETSPLLLGSLGSSSYIYTPLIANDLIPTFYYVNLLGIAVDGTQVDYPAGTFDLDPTTGDGGIILDSGTTVTQLFDAAYTPFLAAVSALITYPTVDQTTTGFDLCYDTSSVATPVFPTITFQFQNLNLDLRVPNTFLEIDDQGTYCLYFQSTNTDTGVSIFGSVQQQNYAIGYDVLNGRVGFAGGAC